MANKTKANLKAHPASSSATGCAACEKMKEAFDHLTFAEHELFAAQCQDDDITGEIYKAKSLIDEAIHECEAQHNEKVSASGDENQKPL